MTTHPEPMLEDMWSNLKNKGLWSFIASNNFFLLESRLGAKVTVEKTGNNQYKIHGESDIGFLNVTVDSLQEVEQVLQDFIDTVSRN